VRPFLYMTLLFACSSDDAPTTPKSDPQAEDLPYISDEALGDTPSLQPKVVSSAVQSAVEGVMALRASPLFDAYRAAVDGGDAECPRWAEDNDGTPYWVDTCTTGGTRFAGVGAIVDFDTYSSGGSTYSGSQLYLVGSIQTPEGNLLQGSGGTTDLYGIGEAGELLQYISIEGEFSWDGPGADGGWLASDVDPSLQAWATTGLEGWRSIYLNGTISGTGGATAVVFHGLTVYSGEAITDDCTPEPTGAISVLNEDGQWIDLEFDTPEDAAWPPTAETCDGCAQGWAQGRSLGEVCPDVSGLRDWDGPYPWL
jgi:hypothetical protein